MIEKKLIALLLDNECDPQSPYVIELHCSRISFEWERVVDGYWKENEEGNQSEWIPGEYVISNIKVGWA